MSRLPPAPLYGVLPHIVLSSVAREFSRHLLESNIPSFPMSSAPLRGKSHESSAHYADARGLRPHSLSPARWLTCRTLRVALSADGLA